FFFQAEDGIRDRNVTGVQTCALPISSDNVSELTARVNDEGWETAYAQWLRGSRLDSNDMVFVFSVGGGDVDRNISRNLVKALQRSEERRVGKECRASGSRVG